jgi:prenyltransferase beta subunit
LKYFGGEIPDARAARQFIQNCYQSSRGGFGMAGPNSSPDVITTAVGLMAVVELKMPAAKYTTTATAYLEKKASSFEDIRMAAAGLEAVKKRPAKAADWLGKVDKLRHRDGTYGKGDGMARATGSAVVTVLRLGGTVKHREAVLKALRKGQRSDGAFGKEDAKGSDLETTYRVMRAFVMLKEKPLDVKAIRAFAARCRNKDGGYGVSPGQPSSVAATYFAAIILHWLADKPMRSGRG